MGRIKTAQINLRITPLEKEKLISKSEEARMNMSQYILALSEQKKIIGCLLICFVIGNDT